MSSKFIAMDKYPLDISRAYVHKTFVGGVFSIIYASIWIALTVSIIVKYFQSPDVLNSHLISGIDQQYSRPNYSLVTVKSKLILQDHDATDLKDFFNYFLFAFMYRENVSSLPKTQFIECDFTDGKSCQFSLSLKDEYFSVSSDDYPSINLISCTDFKNYKDKGLIIIDDDSLLTKCTGDVSEVYSKSYIGSKFVYDITMPFYSLTKKYMVNVNDKVYETMFKVEEALPDKYVFEQIKIQTEYSNYFFFGSKNTSTYINWRYPDKDGISLYLSNNYQYTIVFSSRNGDIMWYYEVTRGSLLTILIDLGGLLKFVGLFLYLPMIWNKYFRQKALLTLNNFFERNSVMNENNTNNSNSQITTNSKEEKLTVKTNQEIDWKRMTFTEYFCSKLSKFWCCCCSKSKKLRAERRKGLSQLESASFIRFGFDGKWVDIRNYFPGYTDN